MAPEPTKNSPRAFTLIELLVVISVLAIVLGLLMPTLVMVRSMARGSACISNVRQLETAFSAYALDNHGMMMVNSQLPPTGGVKWWFGWTSKTTGIERDLDLTKGLISPYLGANIPTKIQCPDFAYRQGTYTPKFAVYAASYGLNKFLSPLEIEKRAVRCVTVKRPARTVVFADGVQQDFSIVYYNEPFYLGIDSGNPAYGGFVHFRHKGLANVCFLDGHVETVSVKDSFIIHPNVGGYPAGNFTSGATDSNTLYGDPRF